MNVFTCEVCKREFKYDWTCGPGPSSFEICLECFANLPSPPQCLAPVGWKMLEYIRNNKSMLTDCEDQSDYELRVRYISVLINVGLIYVKITDRGIKELERHNSSHDVVTG